MKKQPLPSSAGFTLIEILIAVAIMVVLTTIGLVSYRQVGISARDGKRKADLESVRQALVFYRTDNGTYPALDSGDLNSECTPGNDGRSAYENMLADLENDGYLTVSEGGVRDPRDGVDCYGYRYQSDGVTFQLCVKLETDATPTVHSDDYCANSP